MPQCLSRFNNSEPEKTIRHISHSIDITLILNKKEIKYFKRFDLILFEIIISGLVCCFDNNHYLPSLVKNKTPSVSWVLNRVIF
jgi:hypothetical protein